MPCIGDMLNVKQYLKNVGITQKEFAERIGLSRPTLDTYIEMFESGQTIPKERYDIIFNRLFNNDGDSAEIFSKRLQKVEELLGRDQRYGTSDLEPEAADYVSLIVRNMNRDLKKADWNKDVYTFVNLLITNYRENEIMQQLVEYFIYLNDIRNVESISEEQIPYFANIFKALHGLSENPTVYDEEDYQNFFRRCLEIRQNKKRVATEQKNKLKDRIQKLIAEYEKKGITDLNEEEIIEAVKNQIIQEKIRDGGSV